jgi:hypothetical protein
MDTHNCPTCGGPACPYCGHRLTIINDARNCLPCIERSIKELKEYMRARSTTVS